MGSRFVQPETRVLTISDGDTLVVKARLTNGEQRAKFARMYQQADRQVPDPDAPGQTITSTALKVNPLQTGLAMVTAYLLDWSLRDHDGRPVPIAGLAVDELERVLDQLSPEDFGEIKDAIEAHEKRMVAERNAQKKMPTGDSASSATSSSPPDLAGATNGSAT